MSLGNFMISKRKVNYLIEYLILNTVLFALLNFLGEFLGKKKRNASRRELPRGIVGKGLNVETR